MNANYVSQLFKKEAGITFPIWGYVWSESYISAKVEPEKFDKILQVYDCLLSDEGALLGAYGPEGDLYEVVDGKVRMYDKDTAVQDKYPSCIVFSNLFNIKPTETMTKVWDQLLTLEKQTYTNIIYGKQSIDTFDGFVAEWKAGGGDQITQEVNEWHHSVR